MRRALLAAGLLVLASYNASAQTSEYDSLELYVIGGETAQDFLDQTENVPLAVTADAKRLIVFYADSEARTGDSPPDSLFATNAPLECEAGNDLKCCVGDDQWLRFRDRWIDTGLTCSALIDGRRLPAPMAFDPPLSHALSAIAQLDETLFEVPSASTRFFTATAAASNSCTYSVSSCNSDSNVPNAWACVGPSNSTGKLYKKKDCMGNSNPEWYKWSTCQCKP